MPVMQKCLDFYPTEDGEPLKTLKVPERDHLGSRAEDSYERDKAG